jgi:osmotically-inducible protein OsmY
MKSRISLVGVLSILLVLTVACGSMNRATPAGWDKAAMEGDVRGKVATAVPGKTFDIGVSVSDQRVVTLTGTVDSESDRRAIGDAAQSVSGVQSVINNITLRR